MLITVNSSFHYTIIPVERQRTLTPSVQGSNPCSPAKLSTSEEVLFSYLRQEFCNFPPWMSCSMSLNYFIAG